MRKAVAFALVLGLWGCSAGDLQLEVIDFESAAIENCGTLSTETTFFFKLNPAEALVLELGSGLLVNEPSDGEIVSAIPGNSQLTYRIFSGNVGSDYFCESLPPATPSVLEDVLADNGEVRITTVQDPNDSTRFEHTIRLAGVSFVNAAGERLTNLTVEDYGTLSTSTSN